MMRTPQRRRIYLAGPEVFLPHALELGGAKCRLVAELGFEGVFPHDPKLKTQLKGPGVEAERIFSANTAMSALARVRFFDIPLPLLSRPVFSTSRDTCARSFGQSTSPADDARCPKPTLPAMSLGARLSR